MITRLWRWLVEVESDPKTTQVERFGEATLDPALGLTILSDPKRQGLCRAIRERMEGIGPEERIELVDRLFLRFALYVVDLQASERHHHAVPYGLLDHSLEVALKVVSTLAGTRFRVSEDYGTNYHQKPPWLYTALVSALLHDVGKVLDLEVETPDGKDRWDPYVEPLALFCRRNNLKKTGSEFWRYRVGRGVRFHSWHGPMLIPLVLPPKATATLGHRLALVSDAMIAETLDRVPEPLQEFAARIAKTIHEADIETSKADRAMEVREMPHEAPPAPIVLNVPAPPAAPWESRWSDEDWAKVVAGASEGPPVPLFDPAPPYAGESASRLKLPPLDLGIVLKDFTEALRAAVGEGWIPLNKEGGLYVGRKHVYLHFPEGMRKVLKLMIERGSDLEDRFEEDCAAHPDLGRGDFTPEERVFRALLAHKRLPYSNDEMLWIQQGTILHPGDTGQPWEGQVVLMTMPFQDLPQFQGRLDLYQIGDPESEEATNPLAPRPKPPARHVARPSEEAYELRVHAELEPDRLLATLSDALRSGVFHRPGGWSPIYIRPDFIWVLVPETFRILLPRMGILFTDELENRILRSLEGMAELARGEGGQVLFRIKVHSESRQSVWAFAIETHLLLSAEEVALLGPWEHPIRVIENPLPGEYAA